MSFPKGESIGWVVRREHWLFLGQGKKKKKKDYVFLFKRLLLMPCLRQLQYLKEESIPTKAFKLRSESGALADG